MLRLNPLISLALLGLLAVVAVNGINQCRPKAVKENVECDSLPPSLPVADLNDIVC